MTSCNSSYNKMEFMLQYLKPDLKEKKEKEFSCILRS